MLIIGIILIIALFFSYDSYFSFPENIHYKIGTVKLNSVSMFSVITIILLIIPYLSINNNAVKLLNYYPVISIYIFFIPLFILGIIICVFLYKNFDKPYLNKGSEKDSIFKLLFILNILVSSSIFSIAICNLLNYYFANKYNVKYVTVDFIDKEYHHNKFGGFYTYSAVLKEPLLDVKKISLNNDPGQINDKLMKIQVYNGALGIPFIMTNQTRFVNKNYVPEELIANSSELKKELDENRVKSEFLEKGNELKNKIVEQGNEFKNKLKKNGIDKANVIKAGNE